MKERFDYLYDYIENPTGAHRAMVQLRTPVTFSQSSLEWDHIDAMMMHPKDFTEDSYSLVAGTIHLINYIEQRKMQNKPVRTLLFLDRSGRLAAYMLTAMYREINERFGDKGQKIASHKPKIRFINIGKESSDKHEDEIAVSALATTYRKKDLQTGSTVIVDEFVSSGDSLRRAGRTIGQAGFTRTALGLGMYVNCPQWYEIDNVKGVADVVEIPRTTRRALQKLAMSGDQLYTAVETIVQTYGWQTIQIDIHRPFYEQWKTKVSKNKLEQIRTLAKSVGSVDDVLKYFATRGGFLSLPPKKGHLRKSIWYRKKLKDMIQSSFENGLIYLEKIE